MAPSRRVSHGDSGTADASSDTTIMNEPGVDAPLANLVTALRFAGVAVGASCGGHYRNGCAPWVLLTHQLPDDDAQRRRNEVNTARVRRLLFDYSAAAGAWSELRVIPAGPHGATRLLATDTPTLGRIEILLRLSSARAQMDAFAAYLHLAGSGEATRLTTAKTKPLRGQTEGFCELTRRS